MILGLVKVGLGATFTGHNFTRKKKTILGLCASVSCFPESLELPANGTITNPKVAQSYPYGLLTAFPRIPAKLTKACLQFKLKIKN